MRAHRGAAARRGLPPICRTRPSSVRKARYAVDDAVHGVALAPYRALELIAGAATLDRSRRGTPPRRMRLPICCRARRPRRASTRSTSSSAASRSGIGIPDAQPRRIQRVGVVGAGLMATQLATLLPASARGAGRDHRRRRRPGRRGRRRGPGRAREAGERAAGSARAEGALPRHPSSTGATDLGAYARLRPRDRGGVRGARREARGLRCVSRTSSPRSACS